MIATFVGFVLFLGSPIAWHNYKVDPLICFIAFIWGIHILTH